MNTREKQSICRLFKGGWPLTKLCSLRQRDGKCDCHPITDGCKVSNAVREAMNGAPWWPPKAKGKKA